YAVAVGRGQTIQPEDLPLEVTATPLVLPDHLPIQPNRSEREVLVAALDQNHWRRDEAARALGISRTTLWRKMREAGLIG
ncbi:MAG TPA: helix-turn-helix domain-containing protein, partial [Thermoanaerobaculia bacterium]|nr:helix-turn-helix domain-containing protein [Thermoanaerobaculia bacterium]